MSTNDEPVNRRSERADHFRKMTEFWHTRTKVYRVGFFSCVMALVLSEIDLDLSDQIGKRVQFHLNPSSIDQNQVKTCK